MDTAYGLRNGTQKAFWSGVITGGLIGTISGIIVANVILPTTVYSCNFESETHCVSAWTGAQHLVAIDKDGDHKADTLIVDAEPRKRQDVNTPDLEALARKADALLAKCPCTRTY